MSGDTRPRAGTVAALWRYPVKSMLGEELATARVGDQGLFGDRVYGLIDQSDGRVATAKNPRKWPTLFSLRAALVGPADSESVLPSLRLTLPNGDRVTGSRSDLSVVLSRALNREVTLAATEPWRETTAEASVPAAWVGKAEGYWPDIEGLPHRDTVTDFSLPAGTFFDCATVHLVTTATLSLLGRHYPEGRFEVPRFRPNIVVQSSGNEPGFVENSWVGGTLSIGNDVLLRVTGLCGRCVMTSLSQGDLPKDIGILRTVVQRNGGKVGVYAAVVRGGSIRRGDPVRRIEP